MLSAVGVGADFNEYLMTALADAGTGNYYYLKTGDDLASVFARELDGARMTVASALAVTIEPAAGVRVVDAAGYPLESIGSGVAFRPGSLFAGQTRRVWVTLAVPSNDLGEREIGRVALAYASGGVRKTLTFGELPRVACVAGEEEFFAGVDSEAWARSAVVDGYNKMQEDVAREVKAGRRDGAMQALRAYRDETGTMNAKLRSPAVAAQLESVDKLEKEVGAAFEGDHQPERQNALSKHKSAEALDQRRAGAKR
jgi:Ca-activated chloride channel family protein